MEKSVRSVKQPVVGDYIIHPLHERRIMIVQGINIRTNTFETSLGSVSIEGSQYVGRDVVKTIIEEQEGIAYDGWVQIFDSLSDTSL